MPTILTDYHGELINTMRDLARGDKWWTAPVNLGGVPGPSGGTGGPIGGLYGMLVQTKVAYDSTETAYSGIETNIPSGSLVDNLAHIRNRLDSLETLSGITVLDDYVEAGYATSLDFADGLSVTVISGEARIFNTYSGVAANVPEDTTVFSATVLKAEAEALQGTVNDIIQHLIAAGLMYSG